MLPRAVSRLLAAVAAVLLGTTLAPPSAADRLDVAGVEGRLSLAAPASVEHGEVATLQGVLTDADGAPVAGAPVVAEARTGDGGWRLVAGPVVSDAVGAVTLTVAPAVSSELRLREGSADGTLSVPVTVRVAAALTATAGDGVRLGRTLPVTGTLAPAGDGARVAVQQRTAGGWRTAADVDVAGDGTWSAELRPGPAGVQRYRVLAGAPGVDPAVVELDPVTVFRRLVRYSVTTRGRVRSDVRGFRGEVARTYADPRGWSRTGVRFREVERGGDFTVVLSQDRYLPTYSSMCSTTYSCRVGRFVVINDTRWRTGTPFFPGDLATYRAMLINHETGHWLGRGHAHCRGEGRRAPVMQQQSKGMSGCRPNAWPLAGELR